jgi:hypothetical protein
MTADLTIRVDGPQVPDGTTEAAFTCDGCRSVHWFAITVRADAPDQQ